MVEQTESRVGPASYGGKQTIRREMFFIGLFCLAIIAAVVVSMLSVGIYRAGLATAEERISGANRQISAYVEAHLEGLAASVQILAASPDVVNGDSGGEEAQDRARAYFRFVEKANPNVKYCYAGYADGSLLINGYAPPAGYDSRLRPWYTAAVNASPGMNIGQPYREVIDKTWLVAVSMAFFDKVGLRGVVSVDSTLSALDGLLNSIKPFGTQSNFVVNTDGLLLVHNEKSDYINQNIETIVPGVLGLIKDDAGRIEYEIPGAGPRIGYFTHLKINDWVIISAVDREEIMAPVRQRIAWAVTATALVTLLLGFLQLKIYEARFVKPLMFLKERVADITAGKRVDMNPVAFSNAELSAISDSIEGMTESSLARKATELRLILETTSDGLLVVDDQNKIIHYNRRFVEMWGLPEELTDSLLDGQVEESIKASVLPEYSDAVLREDPLRPELLVYLKSGVILAQTTLPILEHESVVGRLWSFKDVTIKIVAEEKLKRQATTDDLTGLWNRRCFMGRAESEIAQASMLRRSLCLALMDVDHFKHINDTHGHAAGDAALKYLADELRSRLRASDTVGRIGGEEFAIILPDASLEGACTVIEQIRTAVENGRFVHADREVSLTVSTGVVAMPEGRTSVDVLLSLADAACYRAKALGRNRTETHRGDIHMCKAT